MAMELSKRAVAMATCTSIPRAINTGIRINAAPTPAMVSKAVKIKVMPPAIAEIITIAPLSMTDGHHPQNGLERRRRFPPRKLTPRNASTVCKRFHRPETPGAC